MIVLHAISGLDAKLGGSAITLHGLAEAQVRAGLEVVIVSTWQRGLEPGPVEQLRAQGIHVEIVGPSSMPLSWHHRLGAVVDRLVARADVVHIHKLWEEITHRTATSAHRQGKPYTIKACGMLDPWSLEQGKTKKALYLRWRLLGDLQRAAALHFTTAAEGELTAPLELRPRWIVEGNGLDWSEFEDPPAAGTFRRRYPELGDRPILLFLSRVHRKKGLELLLPAFAAAAVGDAHLVVAGPGDEDYVAGLRRQVQQLNIQDRVLFTGMLHGSERLEAYAAADLFVLPSHQENFGVVVAEALASGTPVLISKHVNIQGEIVAAGVGGVVDTDVGQLQDALERWVGDTALRSAAAAQARAFARERYDWVEIARRWVDHYAEMQRRSAP